MVRVKICGITRPEDALVALAAGADYLGFILYPPSPRAVAPDAVAAVIAGMRDALPAVFARPDPPRFVGVFVNETAGRIADLMARCGLDLAQLSGDEDERLLRDPASPLFGRAYKGVRPRSPVEARADADRYANQAAISEPSLPALLLDTPHQTLYGGTGQTGDWSLAASVAAGFPGLMLAGGLNPANVAAAVRRVRPFAVDVAGGVEATPGVKDHDLVRAFIGAARTA